ncbi:MAG TPA: restriction endonuclease subunit S [Jatrophihabitans sp.]|jgi:type I restriction enzyme S subunit|uniref:restriction endonuclease subunit S n=1 Tax=Jatrophihabitans sp. TaxID=1932789 RepID=UPI002F1A0664
MTEWSNVTVAEIASSDPHALATGPFGSAISAKNFVSDGVPVIRGSNLSLDVGVRLNDEGLAFLTAAKAAEFKRSFARKGDLVFTCWGTVGQIGLVDKRSRYDAYVVSNKQMKLTPDPKRVDSTFLYYLLSSPELVRAVTGQAIGAAVPGFNLGQLKEVRVRLPSLRTQQHISRILGLIDDLIENNQRRVEVLEEMARAIYREWFVHFRFPGNEDVDFVDSVLGPIPDGWVLGTLGVLAVEIRNAVSPSAATAELPYVPIDEIDRRSVTLKAFRPGREAASSLRLFTAGDVLFGAMRAYFHKVCIAPFDGVTRSTCFVLRPDPERYHYAVMTLADDGTVAYAASHSSGSTIPYAKWSKVLSEMAVVLPPVSIAQSFGDAVEPLLTLAQMLAMQSAHLASIRDALLPRLVTGQIDVSSLDLDALLEGAVA